MSKSSVEYKDQIYNFFEVDKKKIFIKLKEKCDDPCYVELLVQKIFQDFNDIKPDIKEIKDDLILVTVDQDIGKKL